MVLKAARMHNARPFLIAIMATLIATLAAATMSGGWASAQENGTDGTGTGGTGATPTAEPTEEPGDDTPEGQLVRRGLAGNVVRKGESSFVVHTRFGNVHVLVNDQTEIYMPPHGQVRFDALEIGDKVGVLLAKPENDDTSAADDSAAGPDPVLRTATALKIVIVPDRATRRHVRALVVEKVRGRIKIIDENGDEQEIETEVEVEGEAGDELLLVTQDGAEGEHPRLRTFVLPHILDARLERIAEQREEIKERVDAVRERVAEQRSEAIDRVKAALERVEVDAELKARLRTAADELKTRLEVRIEEARDARDERQEQRQDTRDQRIETRNADSDNDGVSDEREQKELEERERQAAIEATKTAENADSTGDEKTEAGAEGVRR